MNMRKIQKVIKSKPAIEGAGVHFKRGFGFSYRDVTSQQIPELLLENRTLIKIICGNLNGTQGPVRDIVIDSK